MTLAVVFFDKTKKLKTAADGAGSVLHFTLHPYRIFVQGLTNSLIMNKIDLLSIFLAKSKELNIENNSKRIELKIIKIQEEFESAWK